MFVFDFLKRVFGWADERPKKRRADSFSFEEEFVTPKRQRHESKTPHFNEIREIYDDDSDIEFIPTPKCTPKNSCQRSKNKQTGRGTLHAVQGASIRPSSMKPSFCQMPCNKTNMGYFAHKTNNKTGTDCDCPTLSKTHRLKEKNQYMELLQNFIPHRVHTLPSRQEIESPTIQISPEIIDVDNPEPSTSKCKPQQVHKMPEILSQLPWFPRNKTQRDKEKNVLLNVKKKEEPSSTSKSIGRNNLFVTEKTQDVVCIATVRSNTLRDKLSAKAVVRQDFISQVGKRYNERIEQRYKEAEELKKMTCILSKHNRLAREAALEEQLARSMRLMEAVLDDRDEPEEPSLPTLTDEMLREVKAALVSRPQDEVLVEGFGLRITRKDIHTLADLNWLNDEVINFYMNLLIDRGTNEKYPNVHAMNTFFYPKLLSCGHGSLKRWTRKVDIFAQDLVVVPVHLGIHWCMSIIDFRDKTIRYYDSMGSRNKNCLHALRQYLEEESLDKKKVPYDTSDWKLECANNIPHQMNGSDCGVFSCVFAEYVSANKKLTFTQQDMPYFRNKMVYEILKAKLL